MTAGALHHTDIATPGAPAGAGLGWFTWLDALLVFACGLVCYCYRLGDSPLAGTEGHRALTAHQMVITGQWLLPHLFDQLYLKKPPLDYWIIATFETLAGHGNELIWRLPSAIGSALLGAVLCVFADRWFGRPAGIVSGIAHLGMIALWQQNRSADIDALNSLAAVTAACFILDLYIRPTQRPIPRTLAAGLAIGATLLLKGPAGMTIVAGAIFGPPLLDWLERRRRPALSPSPCTEGQGRSEGLQSSPAQYRKNPRPNPVPEYMERGPSARRHPFIFSLIALLIGVACFAEYALAALHAMHVRHLPPDTSGLAEAADKANAFKSPIHWFWAAMLAPTLFIYALPVSLVLLITFRKQFRDDLAVRAIHAALVVACVAAFCSGMINPRYAYVMLPMLALLAGAVAAAWKRGALDGPTERSLLALLMFLASAYAAMACVFAAIAWRGNAHPLLVAVIALAALSAMALAMRCIPARQWKSGLLGLIATILLAALLFSDIDNRDKTRRTAREAGLALAAVVGADPPIVTGVLPLDQPELFHYANARVRSYPEAFKTPYDLRYTGWVLFQRDEYRHWLAAQPGRISKVKILWPPHENKDANAYLVWYEAGAAMR